MDLSSHQGGKRRRKHSPLRAVAISCCMSATLTSLALSADAQPQLADTGDLAGLSLESLMDIKVYSVSKSDEPLMQSAAAVFVLTGDEILRSGVRTLPDALRLIPGVNVARVNAHTWAVTSRGFNGTLVDKLEVLMDGRSLYTPLYSGVYWQQHNIPMSSIARIEVIRGPGAALWGSHAVNGVINIVTREANSSDPQRLEAGVGSSQQHRLEASGNLSVGRAAVRVYAAEEKFNDLNLDQGGDASDGFRSRRAGFRSDLHLDNLQKLTLSGEVYRDTIAAINSPDQEENDTDFLLAHWVRLDDDGAVWEVTASHQSSRLDIPNSIEENRSTSDIELKRKFRLGQRHNIVGGIGYRYTRDTIHSRNPQLEFAPNHRDDETTNLYLQDQIEVIPDTLRLTAGIKAEDNKYSGLEIQPTLRFAYTPDTDHNYWGAVSRAVRIPTRLDEDFQVYAPGAGGTPIISGSTQFEAEEVLALELGHRKRLSNSLSADIAAYYNDYDKLRGLNAQGLPSIIANVGAGRSHGIEMALQWQPTPHLHTRVSYDYQQIDVNASQASGDTSIASSNDNDPRHQLKLTGDWKITDALHLNSRLRSVSALDDRDISGYTELDLNLRWQLSSELTVSLLGENLLHKQHLEFSTNSQRVAIPRAVFVNVTWSLQ